MFYMRKGQLVSLAVVEPGFPQTPTRRQLLRGQFFVENSKEFGENEQRTDAVYF